jgi:DNA-binding NarL/FixJ family response regulator
MWRVVNANGKSRIRVLIVDRHEAVRRALHLRLSASEHLDVVGSLPEITAAREIIDRERPDIILLGLQNGTDEELHQTATAVRQIACGTAVIILAPYADAVEREVLMSAGAKRYLLKQINSKKLIQEIESTTPA